jgi:hypothetical protein
MQLNTKKHGNFGRINSNASTRRLQGAYRKFYKAIT